MVPRTQRSRLRRLLGIALVSGACGRSHWLGLPSGGTVQSRAIADAWFWFTAAGLAVGGLVLGLIVYVLVRYRHRPDTPLPPQTRYNIPIEVGYTVVPVLLVAILFVVSVRALGVVQEPVPPDMTVEVISYQWGWTFKYPDQGRAVDSAPDSVPQLVLPANTAIRLVLESRDVVHSFYVPGFLFKHDLIPGERFEVDITTTDTGTYSGQCAEFCGLAHRQMGFQVRVVDGDEFDRWVAEAPAA